MAEAARLSDPSRSGAAADRDGHLCRLAAADRGVAKRAREEEQIPPLAPEPRIPGRLEGRLTGGWPALQSERRRVDGDRCGGVIRRDAAGCGGAGDGGRGLCASRVATASSWDSGGSSFDRANAGERLERG